MQQLSTTQQWPMRIAVTVLDRGMPMVSCRNPFAGRVRLLTGPETAGYVQNPISVYYCYDDSGALKRCIAEVRDCAGLWGADAVHTLTPQLAHAPEYHQSA